LLGLGQGLNLAVFERLGYAGAFYSNEFCGTTQRVQSFPFSLFKHPQYVGAVLSIWGLFLVIRFPDPDWVVLPALETALYAAGGYLENRAGPLRRACEESQS